MKKILTLTAAIITVLTAFTTSKALAFESLGDLMIGRGTRCNVIAFSSDREFVLKEAIKAMNDDLNKTEIIKYKKAFTDLVNDESRKDELDLVLSESVNYCYRHPDWTEIKDAVTFSMERAGTVKDREVEF